MIPTPVAQAPRPARTGRQPRRETRGMEQAPEVVARVREVGRLGVGVETGVDPAEDDVEPGREHVGDSADGLTGSMLAAGRRRAHRAILGAAVRPPLTAPARVASEARRVVGARIALTSADGRMCPHRRGAGGRRLRPGGGRDATPCRVATPIVRRVSEETPEIRWIRTLPRRAQAASARPSTSPASNASRIRSVSTGVASGGRRPGSEHPDRVVATHPAVAPEVALLLVQRPQPLHGPQP